MNTKALFSCLLLFSFGWTQAQTDEIDTTILKFEILNYSTQLTKTDFSNSEDLSVVINPIKVDTINQNRVKETSGLVGDYSTTLTIRQYKNKQEPLAPSWEDALDVLFLKDKVNIVEHQFLLNYAQNPDQSKIDSYLDFNKLVLFADNPFLFDQQHLLVMELTFTNKGDQALKITNNFSIQAKKLQAPAYTFNELVEFHKISAEAAEKIWVKDIFGHRRNLPATLHYLKTHYCPDELTLLPKASTKKLIAFPPSVLNADELLVYHDNHSFQTQFKVAKNQSLTDEYEAYLSFPHDIKSGGYSFMDEELVIYSSEFDILRGDDVMIINEDDLDTETTLVILAKVDEAFYFHRIDNFTFRSLILPEQKKVKYFQPKLKRLKVFH